VGKNQASHRSTIDLHRSSLEGPIAMMGVEDTFENVGPLRNFLAIFAVEDLDRKGRKRTCKVREGLKPSFVFHHYQSSP
jgi:hypothetical protein